MRDKVRVKAWPEPWTRRVVLCVYVRDEKDNHFYLSSDFTLRAWDPATEPEYCLKLNLDEAQILMDSLWDSGVRPTEGKGSAGQLTAVERHLEDMRTIVQNNLGVVFK